MTEYELASTWLQGLIIVLGGVSLVVYYRQLRVMSGQLAAAQEASKSQSILSLVEYLQSPDTRNARTTVRTVLSKKPLAEWNQEERACAALVASNYDVAAALIRGGVAPVDLIADNWGPSIKHCHEVLEPFILEIRCRDGSCMSYWSNFDWLANQACRRAAGLL